MSERENQKRKNSLRFTGDDIVLTITLMEKLKNAVDIVYYLMDHKDVDTFVLILINAQNLDLKMLLNEEKRVTDILFEIDKENSIYTLLCQDTKVDGGYRFAERLVDSIVAKEGTDIYCVELEVRSTKYELRDVMMKLVETFIKTKQDEKSSEIIHKSLN